MKSARMISRLQTIDNINIYDQPSIILILFLQKHCSTWAESASCVDPIMKADKNIMEMIEIDGNSQLNFLLSNR